MEILDFTPELAGEWDQFVETHPSAAYGHLSAQATFAAATPGIRNLSIAVRDGKHLAGVLPLFGAEHRALRRIPVKEISSAILFPAGPLVTPKLQGKAEARVISLLLDGMRARAAAFGADRVVITHPNVVDRQPSIARFGYSPLLHHGFKPRPGVGLLLDLGLPPEQLASARHSGCRQRITKAQALGVSVETLTDRDEWMRCRDINVQTLGDLAFSDAQMAVIWDAFIAAGRATAYVARFEGAIAAMVVTIQHNASAYYWIGLNRRPAPVVGANHLALWTAILASRDQGRRYFELGSLDFENAKNIGISQFKQSFGGVPYQIISAQYDMRPVKTAALVLGETLVASLRARVARRGAAETQPSAEPAKEGTATPARQTASSTGPAKPASLPAGAA